MAARVQTAAALLRGINVGGKHKLPMRELAAIFAAAGCQDVRTYIQSGNVVFGASPALLRRLAKLVQREIESQFGYQVPVILRTARELLLVLQGNPYRKADQKRLHVVFLDSAVSAKRAALLDPKRSPPDEFSVKGREIYLFCPAGFGKSKLGNDYFESKLGVVGTVRNWNTVNKLVELTQAAG